MSCLERSHLAGLAMLPPGDPEREAAEAHAASCPRCAEALSEAARALAALDVVLPDGAEVAATVSQTKVGLLAALADDARRVAHEGWVALGGAGLVFLVALGIFRVANPGLAPVLECAVVIAVAFFAAWNARTTSSAKLSIAVVIATSLLSVAFELRGAEAGLAEDHGVACLAILSAAAIVPAAIAGWLASRTLEPGAPWRIAARAGAAGLVGQGALALVCGSHGLPHLMVFHFAGLGAVLLLGAGFPSVFLRLRSGHV